MAVNLEGMVSRGGRGVRWQDSRERRHVDHLDAGAAGTAYPCLEHGNEILVVRGTRELMWSKRYLERYLGSIP